MKLLGKTRNMVEGLLRVILGGHGDKKLAALHGNDNVVESVSREQEGMLRKRKVEANRGLMWEDTRCLSLTSQVTQETLRIGSVSFTSREAFEYVEFEGYFIPKCWKVLPLFRSIHLSSDFSSQAGKSSPSKLEVEDEAEDVSAEYNHGTKKGSPQHLVGGEIKAQQLDTSMTAMVHKEEAEISSFMENTNTASLDPNDATLVRVSSHSTSLLPILPLQQIISFAHESRVTTEMVDNYHSSSNEGDVAVSSSTTSEWQTSFENFKKLLEKGGGVPVDLDMYSPSSKKLVNFHEYLVYAECAPVLEKVFSIHGDISSDSRFSLSICSILLCRLGVTLLNMSKTPASSLSESFLLSWNDAVRDAMVAGFKVSFLWEHLQKLCCVYFGRNAEDPHWKRLSDRVFSLKKQIANLQRELESAESDLCSFAESSISNDRVKCLIEADLFSDSPASFGLF